MTTPTISKVKGTGYRQVSMPTLSPEQQRLFAQIAGGIQPGLTSGLDQLSQLAGGGSQEYFDQLEAPAMRQFNELQGQLASRFSGMGTGARRSSGFGLASSGAATDLAERLQSQRLGLQRDAISQLLGLYGNLMGTQTFDTAFVPKQQKKSFFQELAESLMGGASNVGGIAGGIGLGKKLFG